MRARSDPAARSRAARRRERGHLDQEQRVAATAFDEIGDPVVVDGAAVGLALDHRLDERGRVDRAERRQRHPEHERAIELSRRPCQVLVGSLARDEQEREVGERTDDDGHEVAHDRVGPLQVVDPEHRHAGLGVTPHHVGDDAGDPIERGRGVEPIEVGGVAGHVVEDADQRLERFVAGFQRPQVAASAAR